jgi:hypothetical protein
MKCILHENQSPVQEIRNETTAKNVIKGNENRQLPERQLSEEKVGSRQGRLWRTALLWSQVSLKGYGQIADRAKDFRRGFIRRFLRRCITKTSEFSKNSEVCW